MSAALVWGMDAPLGGTIIVFLLAFTYAGAFRRRFVRPLGLVLRLLKDTAGALPQARGESFAGQALALRRLMQDYHRQKTLVEGYEERLRRSSELVQSLRHERVEWLASASQEMDQVFEAISAYAEYLKEKTGLSLRDVEECDYDEVEEAGHNLKFVAGGFYLQCVRQMNRSEAVEEKTVLEPQITRMLGLLAPALERRDIRIDYLPTTRTRLPLDAMLLQHLVWGILYLAVRFAATAAQVTVSVFYPSRDTVSLRVEVSEYGLVRNPEGSKDFGPFALARSEQARTRVLQRLSGHVNSLILRSILQDSQGGYRVDRHGGSGYFLEANLSLSPRIALETHVNSQFDRRHENIANENVARILEIL